jgi:hypothetical protein
VVFASVVSTCESQDGVIDPPRAARDAVVTR